MNENFTPIESGFAVYDATFNRYYLTLGGYQALSGIDLTTYPNLNVSPTQLLNAASDTLYDILIGDGNIGWFSRITTTNLEANNYLMKALAYQATYLLEQGNIANESGINWETNTLLDKEYLKRAVSPMARNILTNHGLMYCGRG